MTAEQLSKLTRKPVSYSAGTVILRLKPGEESVALVFNIQSQEVMVVPKSRLKRPEYRNRIIEMREDDAIVSFDQRSGLGTPFGKEEDEDAKDRVKSAERETLEETGRSISGRIITAVLHTEKPNTWAEYTNTVYLANGLGFTFDRSQMQDPYVDPRFSGFYFLSKLPLLRRHPKRGEEREKQRVSRVEETGTYYAAFRRIVSILLQLDRPLLGELGRPDAENAEDLAQMILDRLSYFNLFSQRMMRMFVGLKREDILIEILEKSGSKITRIDLARQIGTNFILWTSGEVMERGLEALMRRVDSRLRRRPHNIEAFLGARIARKEASFTQTALDRRAGEIEEDIHGPQFAEEEREATEDGTEDYRKLWLAMDPEESVEPTQISPKGGDDTMQKKFSVPTFFACIGNRRACGKAALPGELTCENHKGETQINLPSKVLVRCHFAGTSSFGQTIVDELIREGVPLIERTKTRQDELDLKHLFTTGIRVFGEEDLGPNVVMKDACVEMETLGYHITNVHILSLDKLMEEMDPDRLGSRTVVYSFEYGAKPITLTATAEMLLEQPFMSGRVYVNLVDAEGTQLHAVELTAYQHGHPAHYRLQFAKSIWGHVRIPRPEKTKPGK